MAYTLFNDQDLREMAQRGIRPEGVALQIEQFRRGFAFCRLDRPCTVGDGILVLDPGEIGRLSRVYSEASGSGRAMKFVPASGAASRMFKSLLSLHGRAEGDETPGLTGAPGGGPPEETDFLEFAGGLREYAFWDLLRSVMARDGLDLETELRRGSYRAVLDYTLTSRGLNLADLPKGMILFHRYPQRPRTAFEEHLAEGAQYVRDRNGQVRVHFTVSPEHRDMVVRHLEEARHFLEDSNTRYQLGFSAQEPATDTIAVDRDNRPFRDRDDRLVFRPGGHGALLRNLQNLQGDIVFIKNIDNVVPDRLKGETKTYKQALGGCLVENQAVINEYLGRLAGKGQDRRLLDEVFEFLRARFPAALPRDLNRPSGSEAEVFLRARLNRPLRVCGMVRNQGEPGGGPFWVRHADGTLSPQIVESSQVDLKSPEQRAVWEASTHFNPVDLVCGVRDYQGNPFDLSRYLDQDTGFVSLKSKDGRELKALELPGLWNGAMAHWNTLFVEVPSSTFHPVKTVLDLLRPSHRS